MVSATVSPLSQAALSLVRLFYTLLYTATALMALAWWVQREESLQLPDVIGARQANAQTAVDRPAGAPQYGQPPSLPQFGAGFTPPPTNGPVSRPEGWVGGPINATAPAASLLQGPGGLPVTVTPQPVAAEERFDGPQRIAQVGTEFVLLTDVLSQVNDILAKNADKMTPAQMEQARDVLVRQRLEQLIQTKLVVCELRRKIPADNLKKIQAKIGEQFDEVEVPKAIERSQLKTRSELEDDLRKVGSSIDRERRAFVERMLAMSWVQQNVKFDTEVTHEQMLEYYQSHLADYDQPGRVRWQHLQIRFEKYSAKPAAYAALATAGNQVMAGADFAAVAKSVSQGWTAQNGGYHDWTTQGSLSSDALNKALFTLPVGQLSPIIEDERSFHIVKVLERQEAGRTPFTEVQNEIKDKIKQERSAVASKQYLEKLKATTQVWTIYDSDRPMPSDSPGAIYTALPPVNPLR